MWNLEALVFSGQGFKKICKYCSKLVRLPGKNFIYVYSLSNQLHEIIIDYLFNNIRRMSPRLSNEQKIWWMLSSFKKAVFLPVVQLIITVILAKVFLDKPYLLFRKRVDRWEWIKLSCFKGKKEGTSVQIQHTNVSAEHCSNVIVLFWKLKKQKMQSLMRSLNRTDSTSVTL